MKALATDLLLLFAVPLLVAVGSVLTLAALLLAAVGAPLWFVVAIGALWRRARRLPPDEGDSDDPGTLAPHPVEPRRASVRAWVPGAVRT